MKNVEPYRENYKTYKTNAVSRAPILFLITVAGRGVDLRGGQNAKKLICYNRHLMFTKLAPLKGYVLPSTWLYEGLHRAL